MDKLLQSEITMLTDGALLTEDARIIAVLVSRLGGKVLVTHNELKNVEGLIKMPRIEGFDLVSNHIKL